jgi:hypothetical protein
MTRFPVPQSLAVGVVVIVLVLLCDAGATARAQPNHTVNKADIDR